MASREALKARVVGITLASTGPVVTLAVSGDALETCHRLFGAEVAMTMAPIRARIRVGIVVDYGHLRVPVVGGPLLVNDEIKWQIKPPMADAQWVPDSVLEVPHGV